MSNENEMIHAIRVGNVEAQVNQVESLAGKFYYHIVVVVYYRDSDGNSRSSTRYGYNDLPKVEIATRKAYEFINALVHQPNSGEENHACDSANTCVS